MQKLLVVDDDMAHRMMLRAVLSDEGYTISEADDGVAAVEAVKNTLFDLILMDVRMTEMDGIEALEEIKRISPGLPVLMMTAYPEVPVAVKAMKLGAWDYLTKPLDTDELRLRIAKLLGGAPAKEEQPPILPVEATNLIGKSRNMKQVLESIALVAPTDTTVLILGESGTGKELVADAVHANSDRAKKPFVKVNCAALPEKFTGKRTLRT